MHFGIAALAIVTAIIFLATLVRSTFGFGEALVGVPLLAMLMPVKLAAPLAVLVSVTVAIVVLVQDFQHVHLASARRLVVATVPGLAVGLVLLERAPEAAVKTTLALVILAFCLWSLRRRVAPALESDRLAWLFGFGAGVLGGAYGMNGPPLAIYGQLRRWSPERFRATLQGYFLVASALGIVGYWSAGLWTAELNRCYLASLPGMLVAIVAGRAINRRFDAMRFRRAVFVGLALVAIVLLAQALAK